MKIVLFSLLFLSPVLAAPSNPSSSLATSTSTKIASSHSPSSTKIVASPTPTVNSITNILGTCSGSIRQRREIRDFSQVEINAFINAFISVTKSGEINSLITLHNLTIVHFKPYFFPWHRIFLRKFEDLMQTKLGSDWAMPYWDWSIDSQHPEQSVIFTSNFFGQNDQTGGTGQIVDSLMKGFQAQVPKPHLLTRGYKGAMGVFTASSLLEQQFIVESFSFSTFSLNFEYNPHATVHSQIGGDMGNMTSPNDIIFWLHHAFVDKVWWEWQSLGNNINKYDGVAYGNRTGFDGNTIIPDYFVPVNQVFDVKQLCFTYISPSDKTFNQSIDNGLKNITAPSAPTAWLNQSANANLTLANSMANQSQIIVQQINNQANKTGGVIPVQRATDNIPINPSKNSSDSLKKSLTIAFLVIIGFNLLF